MDSLLSSNLSSFNHQISGHSCFLKRTEAPQYVYKPYNRAEAEFYEFISKKKSLPLSDFVPTYYGVSQLPISILQEIAYKLSKEDTSLNESDSLELDMELEKEQDPTNLTEIPDYYSETSENSSREEWLKQLFLTRFNKNNISNFFGKCLCFTYIDLRFLKVGGFDF